MNDIHRKLKCRGQLAAADGGLNNIEGITEDVGEEAQTNNFSHQENDFLRDRWKQIKYLINFDGAVMLDAVTNTDKS